MTLFNRSLLDLEYWPRHSNTSDQGPEYSHITVVSISQTECQCMDCLRKWPKEKNFKSNWPQYDREGDSVAVGQAHSSDTKTRDKP